MTLIIEAQSPPLREDSSGVMRVGNTRVSLDTIVHAFDQGHAAEEIVTHYPALRLADVYAVISYYLNNQAAVADYLKQQKEEAEKIWYEIEAAPDFKRFRERLLARKHSPDDYNAT